MKNFLSRNYTILIVLILIGYVIHFRSFQIVPYGDDWRFIYNFFTHEEIVANFSPFPGIFAYLAPYGPSALTIGFLYQVFESKYYIYYLIPLIFKILTAFIIFMTLKEISIKLKKKEYWLSFLAGVLFLVGTTGIQAIDWAFHINVYIALSIFVLSLFFQIRFSNYGGKSNLLLGLLLLPFSILVAPFRMIPVVLLAPLIDLILLTRGKGQHIFFIVLLKNIIFAIFIFLFFWIGLFGHSPQDLYSPFPITESIKQIIAEPLLSAKTFLHWIGVSILPAYPAGSSTSYITGAIFMLFVLVIFYKYRGKYIILGSILYFIPLFLMWLITPTRNIDSGDKYLPLSFLGLCFLIGASSLYLDKLKNIFKIIILSLVLIQAASTIKIYIYWISIGRGSDFIVPVQEKIMSHFPNPITEPKIIYLDFDNAAVQQSVVFGLGYRVAVLSGTKGLENFPILVSKEENLRELIQQKAKFGGNKKIIENVSAFRYKDREFFDITSTTQENLKSIFKD